MELILERREDRGMTVLVGGRLSRRCHQPPTIALAEGQSPVAMKAGDSMVDVVPSVMPARTIVKPSLEANS
jgi:hypothetical protein